MRAVSLLSGGLDSLLATRMMIEQGLEVHALNFVTTFCTCTPKSSSCSAATSAVRQLGIELKVLDNTEGLIGAVKSPRFGYGRNMNPCLDCRILMFSRAREHMEEIGAEFLITGEVLGERPMSQHRDALRLIEKESGLSGLIVRPLSAALLEPSIPEQKGWVDRQAMLAISGRSRRPQMELAESFELHDYPCPAGGCRLTDPQFAARIRDLLEHRPDFTINDTRLLKVGRHFRLSPHTKAVVGREEPENERLTALAEPADVSMEPAEVPGPLTVLRGESQEPMLQLAAAITARYTSKAPDESAVRVALIGGPPQGRILEVMPAGDDELDALRIGA